MITNIAVVVCVKEMNVRSNGLRCKRNEILSGIVCTSQNEQSGLTGLSQATFIRYRKNCQPVENLARNFVHTEPLNSFALFILNR